MSQVTLASPEDTYTYTYKKEKADKIHNAVYDNIIKKF